jgi:hypothetical protein
VLGFGRVAYLRRKELDDGSRVGREDRAVRRELA